MRKILPEVLAKGYIYLNQAILSHIYQQQLNMYMYSSETPSGTSSITTFIMCLCNIHGNQQNVFINNIQFFFSGKDTLDLS